ncbi:MAG: ABC transporter permease [Candidatus Levyibacteriota bacterium]
MQYTELFSSAIKALRSNILRTALTMLGIVIGIASVIMILSLGQGASQAITDQVSSLGTNLIIVIPGTQQPGRVTSTDTLKYTDVEALAGKIASPNVSSVRPQVSINAAVVANGQNKNIPVQGVGADYASIYSLSVDQGEFVTQDDVAAGTRVAVLGPTVVTDLFGADASPIGQTITIKSRSFRVIGVTAAKGSSGFTNPDETVYIPVTTGMREILGQDYVAAVVLSATNPNEIDQTMTDIKNFLLDRHKITDPTLADFTIRSSKDAISILGTITGILTGGLAGIAAISLVVGGIGIMNIMLVTVTERTREIGLLKAIGAKRKDILTQFLIEAVVLTLSGGVVGIIIGISFTFIITRFAPIPFVLSPVSIILAVGVSTVVGLIFGIYPAQRAAKLSPIDALRYE